MNSKEVVLAHSFGERYALPIPLWLFVVSGMVVVLLSFVLVLRLKPETTAETDASDAVPQPETVPLGGLVALAVTAVVGVLGLIGNQEPAESLATTYFWLFLWILVPLVCGLVGDVTRRVNPFATAAQLLDRPSVRRAVLARSKPLTYRPALAWWPALVLFVALVLAELVFNSETGSIKPAFVGSLILLYLVANAFLGLLYGAAWRERGEVFSVLWNTWGRQGWFRFGAPGRRGFAGGLDVPFEQTPSRVVLVLLLLISINFDGLLATPTWQKHVNPLGIKGATTQFTTAHELQEVLVLVVLAALVLGAFLAFATWSARLGGHGARPLAALAGLLPSLVPIAYGYLIAHNISSLPGDVGYFGNTVLHPLNGNASFSVDPKLVPAAVTWYGGLITIVAVHVIAVFLAHRHLARAASDEAAARRSEYPWLVAMVLYTAFSLVLIALPTTNA